MTGLFFQERKHMNLSKKPYIGVTCGREFEGDAYNFVIREKYFERIRAGGGIPLLVTHPDMMGDLRGLLFTGGGDLLPDERVYGETVAKEKLRYLNPWRDEAEAAIFHAAKELHIPRIFGICRGMQVVNAMYAGQLHYDIRSCLPEVSENHSGLDHTVSLAEGSLLHRLLKKETVTVNSFHHQAVSKAGAGFSVTAKSPDGVIEAMEGASTLLVQWHPERMDDMQPLFDWVCGKDF